ncbi:MAG: DUF4346 domain-containing protein [Candidatus Micrarchaeota archaeon]
MPLDYVEKIRRIAGSAQAKGNDKEVERAGKEEEKRVKRITEKRNPRFIPDPRGFFVIFIDENKIVAEHYCERYQEKKFASGKMDCVFEGNSAENLCHTIIQSDLVTSLEHAAYLGRELMKAEYALKNKEKYAQE